LTSHFTTQYDERRIVYCNKHAIGTFWGTAGKNLV
jgi:hypothetical protein